MSTQKKLKVTQVRSTIGCKQNQKLVMEALGLRRIRHSRIHNDTPQIRGMLNKVQHIIEVEETSVND